MQTKILLAESDIPTHWYNVVADTPNPPSPYLGPDGKPVLPEAMLAIFPEALVKQEAGRKILRAHPDSEGSLGTAISEAAVRASLVHLPKLEAD